ncbi:MAG TPA: BTAD domain-containing putative transcriptional regulator, partial [Gemmatimonadales bacterium]|nr:BTAD domain-containing putative transcriptional regulator [Gemmatimonadales bacterium]
PFHLDLAGRSLGPSFPGQARTVLEYLVSHRKRPVHRDALLDLLWPDADPSIACSRLRVVMHTLRKSLPSLHPDSQDLVVMMGNVFMVNPVFELRVDVEEFERHWLNGWRLSRLGKTEQALAEYEQAEALYLGDYLEDEPYADWTLLRREALRDAYTSILTTLATMSLEACDYTGAIIWAQRLLAIDNYREDAYQLLMTAHQRVGQPNRAIHWYRLCARMLQQELGIDPSAETQALFSNITSSVG